MLKQDITYEGFDGEKTVTVYFNLNKIEAQRFLQGPLAKKINEITEKQQKDPDSVDANEMFDALEELVLLAYGKREGEEFIKNDTVREEFKGSVQFGELMSSFVTDLSKFADFFVGIMPKDMRAITRTALAESIAENGSPTPVLDTPGVVPPAQAQAVEPPVTAAVPDGVNVTEKTMTRAAVLLMSADQTHEYLEGGFRIIE